MENQNNPNQALRIKLSSLRTTSEIKTDNNNKTTKTETQIYRNRTPSLTEIQKHLIKSNMLQSHHSSTNNSINEPIIQQQLTTQIQSKDLHPLQHSWTLYFDSRSPKRSSTNSGASNSLQAYEAGLQTIGTFNSVEQFSRFFNWTVIPSRMEMSSSVHLFKSHIKPMWEDPANSKGGKWTLTLKSNSNLSLLDKLWKYLVLGLVGEQIESINDKNNDADEDFICGAVVATKPKGNRIQIWVKEKDNIEKINSFGKRLMHVLELDDPSTVSVEFSAHQSYSSSRGGGVNANSHNTPLRPTLGGGSMISGSGIRGGMEEKMMAGAGGPLMRRSTSVEVGQMGSGRINPGINNFSNVGGGMFRGGLTGPAGTLNNRTSQLSSLDPPIQNGVWRPPSSSSNNNNNLSNPPSSESIIRASGLPNHNNNQTNPLMNQFNNNNPLNRRHQSSQNLTTIGSLTGNNNLKSNSTIKPSPLGSLPPGLHDSNHHRQLSSGSSNFNPASNPKSNEPTCSQNHSRNPSPASVANSLGVGIISGS